MADDMLASIMRMTPDEVLQFSAYGLDFVVRYDQRQAYGDNGLPATGLTTGDYEVCTGTIADLPGQKVVLTEHVSPTATRIWAADRVAKFITTRIFRAKLAQMGTRP